VKNRYSLGDCKNFQNFRLGLSLERLFSFDIIGKESVYGENDLGLYILWGLHTIFTTRTLVEHEGLRGADGR